MAKRNWPTVGMVCQEPHTGVGWWSDVVVAPVTKCKHGYYDCETCGTSDRVDALHTTKGGKGAVGRIKR